MVILVLVPVLVDKFMIFFSSFAILVFVDVNNYGLGDNRQTDRATKSSTPAMFIVYIIDLKYSRDVMVALRDLRIGRYGAEYPIRLLRLISYTNCLLCLL